MKSHRETIGWAQKHPTTILGVLVTLAFVLGMRPVRDIFWDLPAVSRSPEGLLSLGLWVYVLGLALAYSFVALVAFRAPTADETKPPKEGWPVKVADLLLWAPARKCSAIARRLGGGVLFASGLALAYGILHVGSDPNRDEYWGLLACVVAVWLGLGRFGLAESAWSRLTRAAGWGLELVIVSSFVGEIFWWLIGANWNPLSWRIYTLWAVTHLCIVVLSFAACADSFGRSLGQRLGTAFAVVGILVAVSGRPVVVGRYLEEKTERTTAESAPPDLSWFDAVSQRLDRIPKHEPVIFVAAAGGGSRAALFAVSVLEALERTPPHGWLKMEPRVATDGGSLADRILFISSVSGGSVASAHYVFGDPPPAFLRSPRNTLPNELRTQAEAELDRLCATAKLRCTEPACFDCRTPEECGASCLTPGCQDYARLCGSFAAEGNPRAQLANPEALVWPFHSSRFDDMAADFNAPLMRGVVYPGIERGESVTAFWSSLFHWQDNWTKGKTENGKRPLLLANVTDVRAGTRLIVGFPALPVGLVGMSGPTGAASSGLPFTQVTRSLKDIDARLDLDVEQAVRMSANFPWGFDLPQVGDRSDATLAIDGGVLDNTGIDTFTVLIERLALLSSPLSERAAPEPLRAAASRLLDELSRRGVVLLEIDSGAKPEEPGSVADALANLALPVYALSMSSYVRATEATVFQSARMQDILARRTSRRVTAECGATGQPAVDLVGDRVIHAIYVLDTENLMTAWALGPRQKAQLLARFLAEDIGQRPILREEFADLEAANLMRCELLANTRADVPLRNLVEDLAIADDELGRLKRAEVEVDAEARRHAYETGEASTAPEIVHAEGWLLVGLYAPWPHAALDAFHASMDGKKHWMTLNVRLENRHREPASLAGNRFVTSGPGYIYEKFPSDDGALEPFPKILPSETAVQVVSVTEWRGSGYYFARVRTAAVRVEPKT